MLEKNIAKFDFNDRQLKQILESRKGALLLCAYYKYRVDSVSGLIPTVKVIVRENTDSNFAAFKKTMQESASRIKTFVQNFKFIDSLGEVTVASRQAVAFSCRYNFSLASGDIMQVRTRYFMIPFGDYYFSISLMDNEKNEDCAKVYGQFLSTLVLTPPKQK